jgi:hypothetical protein
MHTRSLVDPFGRPKAEDIAAYERAKAALNKEAQENWLSETWHREQAAILAERFDYGFQFDNLFPTYFEVRQVGEFDTVTLSERRGMQVFWTARGGYIDETQLKTERWDVPRDTVGFHVSEFEDKLRAGYAETIEQLADLALQRLDAEVNRRMFTLLQAAIPSGSPYYVNATTGLTNPAALYDPAATEEIRRKGRLGVYRGANLVRIQNYTDELDKSYIPANELWVFGGTVGVFAKYGGMITKSWAENTVDYRHIRGRMDCGGVIYRPDRARRIVDGTVTA